MSVSNVILCIFLIMDLLILHNFLSRGDGQKDDKLGVLSSSQCGLVELAAVLFFKVVTRKLASDSYVQFLLIF